MENANQKIEKICALLEQETLQPARQEAEAIISHAQTEARRIIQEAEKEAQRLVSEAKKKIEKEEKVFFHNLKEAGQKSKGILRQEIEHALFHPFFLQWVQRHITQDDQVTKYAQILIEALKHKGALADVSVIVGSQADREHINATIGRSILECLKEKSVTVGKFAKGLQIKLHQEQLTLDITDETLVELLLPFLRRDFRKILFTEEV